MFALNRTSFSTRDSWIKAATGIVRPRRVEYFRPTVLIRFGNSPDEAKRGCWWIDERQYEAVRQWAVVNRLALPHAIRVLCAVAHEWPKGKSAMLFMAKVRTRVPLLAWDGSTRDQPNPRGDDKVEEMLMPSSLEIWRTFQQIYIPGLDDPKLNADALQLLEMQHFPPGASHIFGVPGVPPGTIRH